MKKLTLVVASLALMGILAGCSNSAPKATAEDKQNIDKLLKEGLGSRPAPEGQPPATAPANEQTPANGKVEAP